jgi:hypothetical protein
MKMDDFLNSAAFVFTAWRPVRCFGVASTEALKIWLPCFHRTSLNPGDMLTVPR